MVRRCYRSGRTPGLRRFDIGPAKGDGGFA
jgi:hypothetical protein